MMLSIAKHTLQMSDRVSPLQNNSGQTPDKDVESHLSQRDVTKAAPVLIDKHVPSHSRKVLTSSATSKNAKTPKQAPVHPKRK